MIKFLKPAIFFSCFLPSALLGLTILSGSANAQQEGTDLRALRELVGAENVDGSGVNTLLVEAGTAVISNGVVLSRTYAPSNGGLLTGKTLEDIGVAFQSDGTDGHASTVGSNFSGFRADQSGAVQFGTAPALGSTGNPSIKFISASEWLNDQLGSGNATPVAQIYDVTNHSYIFALDEANGFDQEAAEDVLRRLDYVINEGNTTTVVGTNNGNSSTALPAGLVQAYNTINVGVTDGGHASGPTTLNGAGRNSIHVVVAKNFTSFATPVVSGAAAILHQTGAGTDAVKQEVIKATILAGATKDDVGGTWSNSPTQPLDSVFGAGELNVLNNHIIQTGGEVDGGISTSTTSTVGPNGWDYEEEILANDERLYEIIVDDDETLLDLSIALTWNREIVNGRRFFGFSAEANPLANLSLELVDSLNEPVDSSNSELDNVEHIYFQNLYAGTYLLKVSNLSNNVSTDYGLAFRSTSIPSIPAVVDVEVNFGENQRSAIQSVEFVFDGEVDVADGAVSILKRSDASGPINQTVTSSVISMFDTVSNQTVSTIQFDSHTRNIDNVLEDGNYQLTLNASLVTRNGTPMAEDFIFGDQESDDFFSLYGDSDGDRDVDGVDFRALVQTYFKEEGDEAYNSALDYDADGDVDSSDFRFFAGNYFSTMPF